MDKFIYIATTQGLVRVQLITEEDPDVQSVVCIDHTQKTANISKRYHDFVRKGTGIVHKTFGHGSYRVDVDKPIDQGNSWQLGMYAAHLLHANNALIDAEPATQDIVYVATGSIKSNGDVVAVERVPDKLEMASPLIQVWQSLGCRVVLVVANDQANIPSADEMTELGIDPKLVEIQRLGNVLTLPSILSVSEAAGGDDPVAKVGENGTTPIKPKEEAPTRSKAPIVGAIGVLGLAALIFFGLLHLDGGDKPVDSKNLISDADQGSGEILKADDDKSRVSSDDKSRISSDTGSVVDVAKPVSSVAGISMEAGIARTSLDCDYSKKSMIGTKDKHTIESLPFNGLCSLLWSATGAVHMQAFSMQSLQAIPMKKQGAGWNMPLPQQKKETKTYGVVVLFDGDKDSFEDTFRKQLFKWNTEERVLSIAMVQDWLTENQINGHAMQHSLLATSTGW